MTMKLSLNQKYLYSNIVKVGRQCKKTKKEEIVTYIGSENDKEIFGKNLVRNY